MRTQGPCDHHEQIVLAGKSAPLAGILTEPVGRAANKDRPWLIVLNAGILHKVGPNRMAVHLARQAATRGLTTLRVDFAGTGDCPARADGRPLIDGVIVDVRELIAHLRKTRGVERFLVIGLCSGADNALRVARADDSVVGACLLDPTIHRTRRWYLEHFAVRAVSGEVWAQVLTLRHARIQSATQLVKKALARQTQETARGASAPEWSERPELFRTGLGDRALMEAHLRDVLARHVQLFIAFSGGWNTLYNYKTQLFDAFPAVDFADQLRLEFYPQAGHTFDMEAHRKLLLADILDWAETTPFTDVISKGSRRGGARAGGASMEQAQR
jgi:dienelactone hydrolase